MPHQEGCFVPCLSSSNAIWQNNGRQSMWSSTVQPVIDKHDGVVDIHSAPDICMYRRRVVLWLWSGKRDETKNGNIAESLRGT